MKKTLVAEHKNSKLFHISDGDAGMNYVVEDTRGNDTEPYPYYFAKWAMCALYCVGDVSELPNEALVILINHYHEVAP
jgi:hypothetical protein